jgi:hypothetical protein
MPRPPPAKYSPSKAVAPEPASWAIRLASPVPATNTSAPVMPTTRRSASSTPRFPVPADAASSAVVSSRPTMNGLRAPNRATTGPVATAPIM